jgi:hypothetical protein
MGMISRLFAHLRRAPVQLDRHSAMCRLALPIFGGRESTPWIGESLQSYLDRVGVRHFTARELTQVRPERVALAASLGFADFTPPPAWWPRLALQALAADRLRDVAGEPVSVRNGWRPAAYNAQVGGAPDSAHVRCCALDLVTATPDGWDRAVKWALTAYDDDSRCLNLGVGEHRGSRFVHLGTHDVRGGRLSRRRWRYDDGRPVTWHGRGLA